MMHLTTDDIQSATMLQQSRSDARCTTQPWARVGLQGHCHNHHHHHHHHHHSVYIYISDPGWGFKRGTGVGPPCWHVGVGKFWQEGAFPCTVLLDVVVWQSWWYQKYHELCHSTARSETNRGQFPSSRPPGGHTFARLKPWDATF
jgi:hypothetical protein